MNSYRHVNLRFSSGVYELLTTGLTVRTKGHVPLVSVNKVRLEPHEAMIKAILEYSLTIGGLVVLAPLFLVLSVLIKLDSQGPVFFKQTRLGRNARPFTMLKFRTMYENSGALPPELLAQNEATGPLFKIRRDPRVTRTGRCCATVTAR